MSGDTDSEMTFSNLAWTALAAWRCEAFYVYVCVLAAAQGVYETNQLCAVYLSEVYLLLCSSACMATCVEQYVCGCMSCTDTFVCDVRGLFILGVSAGHVRDDPRRS